jgi:hypothetical protein
MLLLAALLVMSGRPASGNTPPPGIFGTFTKFEVDRTVAGSGDIDGYEVVVLPGIDHPNVVFQCAAGDVEQPVLVPARVEGLRLSFDVPTGPCSGHYEVRLKGNVLVMTHGDETVMLPRGRSYWAPRISSVKGVAR